MLELISGFELCFEGHAVRATAFAVRTVKAVRCIIDARLV